MKETREKILDAACALLAEQGYAGFSYGQLAARLKISKGLVAYHFPQKGTIFQNLVQDYFAGAAEWLARCMDEGAPASALLAAYTAGVLRYVQAHKARTLAVMEIIANARTDGGALVYGDDAGICGPVEEMLRYGQETDGFAAFDPRITARLARSLIDAASAAVAQGRCENEEALIAETVRCISRMVEG